MRTFSPRYPRKYPIVALLLFAAGCFQGEAPETPVRPEKPGARRKAPDCPKGTTPDHFEGENSVSYECVLPNGKRHGPFVRYHANGKKAHEGAWRDLAFRRSCQSGNGPKLLEERGVWQLLAFL